MSNFNSILFYPVPPGLVRVLRKDIDSSMTIRHDRIYPDAKNDVPFVSIHWKSYFLHENCLNIPKKF